MWSLLILLSLQVLTKHRYQHSTYDLQLCRLLKVCVYVWVVLSYNLHPLLFILILFVCFSVFIFLLLVLLFHSSYTSSLSPHRCSPQNEPLTPDDDVDRQLKAHKQQTHEDDSAEIEAASFKKFPVEVNCLTRVTYTIT